MNHYRLQSIDPLLFGDGRPFSIDAGTSNARSLRFPMPNTIAGALRNRFAVQTRRAAFDSGIAQAGFLGPLLTVGGVPYLPAPLDAVAVARGGATTIKRALPNPDDAPFTDIPDEASPCNFDLDENEEPSKEQPKGFWSLPTMASWLSEGKLNGEPVTLAPLEVDARLHVAIDPNTLANQDGMLFRTEGISIGGRISGADDSQRPGDLALEVQFDLMLAAPDCLTLGGERRLATLAPGAPEAWSVPEEVAVAWTQGKRACMVLVTPGCFEEGWNPGEVHGLAISGACVGRRVAYSGWSTHSKMPELLWLAPAGSVYFFDGMPGKDLTDLWLKPVGEGGRDGFGLAVWGVW